MDQPETRWRIDDEGYVLALPSGKPLKVYEPLHGSYVFGYRFQPGRDIRKQDSIPALDQAIPDVNEILPYREFVRSSTGLPFHLMQALMENLDAIANGAYSNL